MVARQGVLQHLRGRLRGVVLSKREGQPICEALEADDAKSPPVRRLA